MGNNILCVRVRVRVEEHSHGTEGSAAEAAPPGTSGERRGGEGVR